MENNEIKKDFSSVVLKSKKDLRQQIKDYMNNNGYNVDSYDICSVKCNTINNIDSVLFKFVHYSTLTMATEPYYKIEFIYES